MLHNIPEEQWPKWKGFKSNSRSVIWSYALVSVFKNTTRNLDCDVSAGDGRSSKSQHITINQYITKKTYFTASYSKLQSKHTATSVWHASSFASTSLDTGMWLLKMLKVKHR